MSFDDFNGVSGHIIQLNKGDSNQTHIISINQDQHCEIAFPPSLSSVVFNPLRSFNPTLQFSSMIPWKKRVVVVRDTCIDV